MKTSVDSVFHGWIPKHTSECSSMNQCFWQGLRSNMDTRLFTSAYCRILMASDWLRTLSISCDGGAVIGFATWSKIMLKGWGEEKKKKHDMWIKTDWHQSLITAVMCWTFLPLLRKSICNLHYPAAICGWKKKMEFVLDIVWVYFSCRSLQPVLFLFSNCGLFLSSTHSQFASPLRPYPTPIPVLLLAGGVGLYLDVLHM